jgi:hypothetical protein
MENKIFVGNAKKTQYNGFMGSVDLGRIIKDLIDQGGDKQELITCFELLFKNTKDKDGFFVQKKEDKKQIFLKLFIGKNKSAGDADFYISLNKWKPEQKAEQNSDNNKSSDAINSFNMEKDSEVNDMPF